MGKKELHFGLLLTPCYSIHTFFLKHEIDVVFLGENNQVLFLIQQAQRGRIFVGVPGTKTVLELPPTVTKGKLHIGDILAFIPFSTSQ
ncbi:hypothetical protein FTV88_2472 [Heliorestis convoluta]|uniref:DUF192 domain-containing protein n=2 Tax=Heliorestis convoluta TaxID=356322 RepID=A0A5Q2N7U9_9FIRM|nr:hypothetical protein FTV88_2472 [Heliorestis convoluta]